MRCPHCHTNNTDKVLDSRSVSEGRGVRRRRMCLTCNQRFTTLEQIKEAFVYVIKRNGHRQLFDVTRIAKGIRKAAPNAEISDEQIQDICARISAYVDDADAPVSTATIGEMVLAALKPMNRKAYVGFAMVYKRMLENQEFLEIMQEFTASDAPETQPQGGYEPYTK